MVTQECLKGNVDETRIDAMFEKGRTLGIQRISECGDWNQYRRLLLGGVVYNTFYGHPDFG